MIREEQAEGAAEGDRAYRLCRCADLRTSQLGCKAACLGLVTGAHHWERPELKGGACRRTLALRRVQAARHISSKLFPDIPGDFPAPEVCSYILLHAFYVPMLHSVV